MAPVRTAERDGIPVIQLEGIGPTYAERLRAVGIRTTTDLLAAEAPLVAEKIQADVPNVRRWQAMSRLIELNGIGPQYAELLVRAGYATVDDLAGLLERATLGAPDAACHRAFTRVVRFELRFWDAVHAGEAW